MIDVLTIDYAEIDKGVNAFRAVFHMDPYLIMSRKTAQFIEKDAIISTSKFAETLEDIDGYTAQLVGCKIALCNDIPYGKIDIR